MKAKHTCSADQSVCFTYKTLLLIYIYAIRGGLFCGVANLNRAPTRETVFKGNFYDFFDVC